MTTSESAAPPGLDDELLTAHEVAAWLKVTLHHLYRLRARGLGPAHVRVGTGDRAVRYRRAEVARWLDEQTRGGG